MTKEVATIEAVATQADVTNTFSAYPFMAIFCALTMSQCVRADDVPSWSEWRGPSATGVALQAKPPVEWGSEKNIRWRTPIPGRGHSTPVVRGNLIFVTTAVPVGSKLAPKMSGRPGEHDNLPVDSKFQFVVICVDRSTGEIRWRKVVHEAVPIEAGHNTASLASASPVIDQTCVYAHFGSHGLYCLDFEGNLRWQKSFGQMHSKHGHGEGASPTLSASTLIINWDHEEQSFLAALDKSSGNELWRRDRKEDTSWSSPIVIEHAGQKQVVVCGTNRVRGYSLQTGDVLWECGGMSSNIVATPVFADGVLYVGSSYEKKMLMAIDLDGATGDITGSQHVLWSRIRGTPYVPSMLLYEDSLYFLTHYQNVLTRVHGRSGRDAPGAIRLSSLESIYASPVGANGYVYITDLSGTTEVITHSAIPRTVSVNRLEERVNASLAIIGDEILIRGENHLFCVANLNSKEAPSSASK
jgi:outer membrane protein assembly factor BamB